MKRREGVTEIAVRWWDRRSERVRVKERERIGCGLRLRTVKGKIV